VNVKPSHSLNAWNGVGILQSVRCGCGILMEVFTNGAGYMEKAIMLKGIREMSYLENVLEVKCSKMIYFANENQRI